jgi:hypothetical protein
MADSARWTHPKLAAIGHAYMEESTIYNLLSLVQKKVPK